MLTAHNMSISGAVITTETNVGSNIHKHHFLTERTSTTNKPTSLGGEGGIFLKTRHKVKMPDINIGILHYSRISTKYNEIRRRNKSYKDEWWDNIMI